MILIYYIIALRFNWIFFVPVCIINYYHVGDRKTDETNVSRRTAIDSNRQFINPHQL